MAINVGERMPQGEFTQMTDKGPAKLGTDELFKGKKVVLFGLPGAFTPTCSAKHVPGFLQNASALVAKGIDTIACVSVNDAFVMGAWAKDQGTGTKVLMLADGSAEYTKKLGLDLDLTARGMGVRAKRFAIVVNDGVAKHVAVENTPADLTVSSAEAILKVV